MAYVCFSLTNETDVVKNCFVFAKVDKMHFFMNFEILIELPPKCKNPQKCEFLYLWTFFFNYMDKLYTKVVICITFFHLLAKKNVFVQQILHHKFLIEP